MFTGIIESVGSIALAQDAGTNKQFWITSPLSARFKPDQSIAHNGVCLTVEAIRDNSHLVTAVQETLQKTNISEWETGDLINLEQCLTLNSRLDGHIVQGHVDTTAACTAKEALSGSWKCSFRFPEKFAPLIIEKGSVCINGISLTAFDVTRDNFSVAIIPYTFEHTNMRQLKKGDTVNIEFDMVGKYVVRGMELGRA
ncbi:riboflavin synthase [Agriterribacter sp.]|uniref:riboflavin synthase n=1 Tax=Agriterribacter sp. TaxID=2821509 RepID=UPI002BC6E516|nr:riboflavin synthase [Agriterribacter sp.]HRP56393.1 riboflavin synthase [Agriterribacter sp.]